MRGVPKYPKTKLSWCSTCGERVVNRRGEPFRTLKGYHYTPDDHECPRTCPHCSEAYTVLIGGHPKDTHTCPGREAAAIANLDLISKMIFRSATRSRRRQAK